MTDTYVIILNGRPRSGKNAFARMTTEHCDTYDTARVIHFSSVDPIRNFMKYTLGWDGKKTDESRALMATLKKFWDSQSSDSTSYVVREIIKYIGKYKRDDKVIFVDVREPHNIEKAVSILKALKSVYNITVRTMYVERPEANINHGNEADDNVENFKYDYVIYNNQTLTELKKLAGEFIDKLMEGDGLDENDNQGRG